MTRHFFWGLTICTLLTFGLSLSHASDSDTPSLYVSPEQGGARNWQVKQLVGSLNLREDASVNAKVIGGFLPGAVLDNLGCQQLGQRTWCDVQPLGGGPRGYVAAEYLEGAIAPHGVVATGPDDSAYRAGQKQFDANGVIPCAQSLGQPMTQCTFGVARAGGGYATVIILRPDGMDRAIFFRMGIPIGADTSQADGYPEFKATKENDLHFIRIGHERYEIPDAVVLGG